jgi:hypothetical protein
LQKNRLLTELSMSYVLLGQAEEREKALLNANYTNSHTQSQWQSQSQQQSPQQVAQSQLQQCADLLTTPRTTTTATSPIAQQKSTEEISLETRLAQSEEQLAQSEEQLAESYDANETLDHLLRTGQVQI